MMTREVAKQNLISLGISEPTDDQISNYLNAVNGEVKKESDKAEKFKNDAEKAADLQKQLDAIAAEKMTEVEMANAERDKAFAALKDMQVQFKTSEMKTKFAERGIKGDAAEKLIKSIQEGTFDFETLGTVLSEKETATKNATLQEIANSSTNPGGGTPGTPDKTEAEKMVEGFGSRLANANKTAESVVEKYL